MLFVKLCVIHFLVDSVFKEDNDKDDLRDFSLDLFGSKYHNTFVNSSKLLPITEINIGFVYI